MTRATLAHRKRPIMITKFHTLNFPITADRINITRRPGRTMTMSATLMRIISTLFPKYPEMRPTEVPMATAMNAAVIPTRKAIRAPTSN